MKKVDLSRNLCELCGEEASLYCDADSANLCFPCDRRVHAANFLVARHVRRLTCPHCIALHSGSGSGSALSGAGSDPILLRPLCSSCLPNNCSSSSCLSSDDDATSAPQPPPARRPDSAAERMIASWSRWIGMERIAGVAAQALRTCGAEKAALPPRIFLAAAILYAAKICFSGGGGGDRTCEEVLRRLERCSGLPAKAILAAESRMARAVRCRGLLGDVSHV